MICAMEKILVSACLIGQKCTYKGEDNYASYLEELNEYYDFVPFCPEVEGGLPTPRVPSELKGAAVVNAEGKDVTSSFALGAFKATSICSYLGIHLAILKENSPSCGVHQIHDGSFKGRLVKGEGMTTAALRRMGVRVMNEEEGKEFLQKLLEQKAIKDEKTQAAKDKEAAKEEEKKRLEEEAAKKAEEKANKPYSKKPFGKKPFSKDRKPFSKDGKGYSKEGKPFRGKKNFHDKDGEGKPFKERGDRKSFGHKDGERKNFGKKPGWSFKGKPTRDFNRKPHKPE